MLAVREALFEEGVDISDPTALDRLRARYGVPEPSLDDAAMVLADLEDGRRRGVVGSPHFFTPLGDFFCPSLRIGHHGDVLDITEDAERSERFLAAALV